jgi:hypothetical protein
MEYRIGDVVHVRAIIDEFTPDRDQFWIRFNGVTATVKVKGQDIVKLESRTFQKGDEVTWRSRQQVEVTGIILDIDGSNAWIKSDGVYYTVPVADLSPVEKMEDAPVDELEGLAIRYHNKLLGGMWFRPSRWANGTIKAIGQQCFYISTPKGVKTPGRKLPNTIETVRKLMQLYGENWIEIDNEDWEEGDD